MARTLGIWLIVGLVGACLVPWYLTNGGLLSLNWIGGSGTPENNPILLLALIHGKLWLLPVVAGFPIIATLLVLRITPAKRAKLISIIALSVLVYVAVQGFLVVRNGPVLLNDVFHVLGAEDGQAGLGIGALLVVLSYLFILTTAISMSGNARGDAFVIGLIGLIIALVAVFVFFPISQILLQSLKTDAGGYSVTGFLKRFFSGEVWRLDCLNGGTCGPAINSIFLGVLTGAGTTTLGLSFALIFTRTQFKAKKLLRVLTIIPIITPPFVIGLALILLFGRSGTVTTFWADLMDMQATRWLYGFWGVYMAQLLSFTPIAFLVLIGVVEGVSPSMEEASQTLNANKWQTFRHVSFPLMRPGLANAFLLGFLESLADFGNPLVLGGNFNVLSTEIFFAIIGTVADPAKAAIMSIALLTLALSAFVAQRMWLGKKSYATVTGKADSGQHASLSPKLKLACYLTALPWALFTAIVYSMIVFGSFVTLWGYDHSFTFKHYLQAFAIDFSNGIRWKGVAWDSYFTTLTISSVAAPLTAILGLATAYLLVRQKFAGKNVFEFSTMMCFAIPGTVIGVSYVMAFNFPPIEITGTSIILIVMFMFRNMPVGVRGGIAAMSQLDKSLDEASITLGANSFTTIKRVILPLLGPAILAALAYSFVRAITSVSAVIFLVSAKHNMATSFIVGRVEAGDYGLSIAYSAVLILTMLLAILLLQALIGARRLRRDNRVR
ncbi:MAG: iron ABC transporter permease [Roseibium sp.]|uniref:ABC transporter permease n=1 Tax=Roseibium sp. TaxID=1936156 RepID=UPI0026268F41|nr:iron ABC transporter permease [Roseibium sp.]MCV0425070.1 iron ABC transporter permease [Roseibium sp.]